jgi:hypothetical protein
MAPKDHLESIADGANCVAGIAWKGLRGRFCLTPVSPGGPGQRARGSMMVFTRSGLPLAPSSQAS